MIGVDAGRYTEWMNDCVWSRGSWFVVCSWAPKLYKLVQYVSTIRGLVRRCFVCYTIVIEEPQWGCRVPALLDCDHQFRKYGIGKCGASTAVTILSSKLDLFNHCFLLRYSIRTSTYCIKQLRLVWMSPNSLRPLNTAGCYGNIVPIYHIPSLLLPYRVTHAHTVPHGIFSNSAESLFSSHLKVQTYGDNARLRPNTSATSWSKRNSSPTPKAPSEQRVSYRIVPVRCTYPVHFSPPSLHVHWGKKPGAPKSKPKTNRRKRVASNLRWVFETQKLARTGRYWFHCIP